MRWLLVASLLCLPMSACGGTQKTEDTETTMEETAKTYKCETCGETSDTPMEHCGAPMVAVE